ncbi:MAG: hypothetical protein C0511_13495, partial [Hyphomicrobium sp.]|nr:hypothetical protein [Hyphomicrobium sp.]
KAQNMGQCQLFSEVKARAEDQTWRSGVRTAGDASSTLQNGFEVFARQSALGDVIKSARVDSANGCMVVCRNTPNCVGGRYKGPNTIDDNCDVLSSVTSVHAMSGDKTTSFRKP